MQVGEETTDGEGIQAAGHDRFQEEGLALASNRAGREWKETEKAGSGLWARDGDRAYGRNPVPTEGRLNAWWNQSTQWHYFLQQPSCLHLLLCNEDSNPCLQLQVRLNLSHLTLNLTHNRD